MSWFQIGAAKAACYDMGKILGLGSGDMPIIGYARVSMTKKMISFVSRNCSKPSVSQRLASMRSSPISVRDLTTKRQAYSDYWN